MGNLTGIANYLVTNVANAILMALLFTGFLWTLNELTPDLPFQKILRTNSYASIALAILIGLLAIAFAMVLRG